MEQPLLHRNNQSHCGMPDFLGVGLFSQCQSINLIKCTEDLIRNTISIFDGMDFNFLESVDPYPIEFNIHLPITEKSNTNFMLYLTPQND